MINYNLQPPQEYSMNSPLRILHYNTSSSSSVFIQCRHIVPAMNVEYVPPYHTKVAMYVRGVYLGSSAQLGLTTSPEYPFHVYTMPIAISHGIHRIHALVLEDFDRAAPHGTGSAVV